MIFGILIIFEDLRQFQRLLLYLMEESAQGLIIRESFG